MPLLNQLFLDYLSLDELRCLNPRTLCLSRCHSKVNESDWTQILTDSVCARSFSLCWSCCRLSNVKSLSAPRYPNCMKAPYLLPRQHFGYSALQIPQGSGCRSCRKACFVLLLEEHTASLGRELPTDGSNAAKVMSR